MRYDSDPQVVKRILTDSTALYEAIDSARLSEDEFYRLLASLQSLANQLLNTLDHFIKMHFLNPQLSLSRFSASTIEQQITSLSSKLSELFSQKSFENLQDQVDWVKDRFLKPVAFHDHEDVFLQLQRKLAQLLETYYVDRIRQTHFVALLNDVVGWSEHIETHGHHDIHAVLLFAEKIARDRAVIEHRLEMVREICTLIRDQAVLHHIDIDDLRQVSTISINLSRMYSPYLLRLYEALLEDIEIIAISDQDYEAFEQYCRANQIEIYEEYSDLIKARLRGYTQDIAADIPVACHIIKLANIIVNAQLIYERYKDVEAPTEVLGQKLAEDIRALQQAMHQLRHEYPEMSQQCFNTLQKIQRLRREIVRPAIRVYGQYMKDPTEFFQKLSEHQAEWLPIIESALSCLEHDDELYQKCFTLRQEIDKFKTQN